MKVATPMKVITPINLSTDDLSNSSMHFNKTAIRYIIDLDVHTLFCGPEGDILLL